MKRVKTKERSKKLGIFNLAVICIMAIVSVLTFGACSLFERESEVMSDFDANGKLRLTAPVVTVNKYSIDSSSGDKIIDDKSGSFTWDMLYYADYNESYVESAEYDQLYLHSNFYTNPSCDEDSLLRDYYPLLSGLPVYIDASELSDSSYASDVKTHFSIPTAQRINTSISEVTNAETSYVYFGVYDRNSGIGAPISQDGYYAIQKNENLNYNGHTFVLYSFFRVYTKNVLTDLQSGRAYLNIPNYEVVVDDNFYYFNIELKSVTYADLLANRVTAGGISSTQEAINPISKDVNSSNVADLFKITYKTADTSTYVDCPASYMTIDYNEDTRNFVVRFNPRLEAGSTSRFLKVRAIPKSTGGGISGSGAIDTLRASSKYSSSVNFNAYTVTLESYSPNSVDLNYVYGNDIRPLVYDIENSDNNGYYFHTYKTTYNSSNNVSYVSKLVGAFPEGRQVEVQRQASLSADYDYALQSWTTNTGALNSNVIKLSNTHSDANDKIFPEGVLSSIDNKNNEILRKLFNDDALLSNDYIDNNGFKSVFSTQNALNQFKYYKENESFGGLENLIQEHLNVNEMDETILGTLTFTSHASLNGYKLYSNYAKVRNFSLGGTLFAGDNFFTGNDQYLTGFELAVYGPETTQALFYTTDAGAEVVGNTTKYIINGTNYYVTIDGSSFTVTGLRIGDIIDFEKIGQPLVSDPNFDLPGLLPYSFYSPSMEKLNIEAVGATKSVYTTHYDTYKSDADGTVTINIYGDRHNVGIIGTQYSEKSNLTVNLYQTGGDGSTGNALSEANLKPLTSGNVSYEIIKSVSSYPDEFGNVTTNVIISLLLPSNATLVSYNVESLQSVYARFFAGLTSNSDTSDPYNATGDEGSPYQYVVFTEYNSATMDYKSIEVRNATRLDEYYSDIYNKFFRWTTGTPTNISTTPSSVFVTATIEGKTILFSFNKTAGGIDYYNQVSVNLGATNEVFYSLQKSSSGWSYIKYDGNVTASQDENYMTLLQNGGDADNKVMVGEIKDKIDFSDLSVFADAYRTAMEFDNPTNASEHQAVYVYYNIKNVNNKNYYTSPIARRVVNENQQVSTVLYFQEISNLQSLKTDGKVMLGSDILKETNKNSKVYAFKEIMGSKLISSCYYYIEPLGEQKTLLLKQFETPDDYRSEEVTVTSYSYFVYDGTNVIQTPYLGTTQTSNTVDRYITELSIKDNNNKSIQYNHDLFNSIDKLTTSSGVVYDDLENYIHPLYYRANAREKVNTPEEGESYTSFEYINYEIAPNTTLRFDYLLYFNGKIVNVVLTSESHMGGIVGSELTFYDSLKNQYKLKLKSSTNSIYEVQIKNYTPTNQTTNIFGSGYTFDASAPQCAYLIPTYYINDGDVELKAYPTFTDNGKNVQIAVVSPYILPVYDKYFTSSFVFTGDRAAENAAEELIKPQNYQSGSLKVDVNGFVVDQNGYNVVFGNVTKTTDGNGVESVSFEATGIYKLRIRTQTSGGSTIYIPELYIVDKDNSDSELTEDQHKNLRGVLLVSQSQKSQELTINSAMVRKAVIASTNEEVTLLGKYILTSDSQNPIIYPSFSSYLTFEKNEANILGQNETKFDFSHYYSLDYTTRKAVVEGFPGVSLLSGAPYPNPILYFSVRHNANETPTINLAFDIKEAYYIEISNTLIETEESSLIRDFTTFSFKDTLTNLTENDYINNTYWVLDANTLLPFEAYYKTGVNTYEKYEYELTIQDVGINKDDPILYFNDVITANGKYTNAVYKMIAANRYEKVNYESDAYLWDTSSTKIINVPLYDVHSYEQDLDGTIYFNSGANIIDDDICFGLSGVPAGATNDDDGVFNYDEVLISGVTNVYRTSAKYLNTDKEIGYELNNPMQILDAYDAKNPYFLTGQEGVYAISSPTVKLQDTAGESYIYRFKEWKIYTRYNSELLYYNRGLTESLEDERYDAILPFISNNAGYYVIFPVYQRVYSISLGTEIIDGLVNQGGALDVYYDNGYEVDVEPSNDENSARVGVQNFYQYAFEYLKTTYGDTEGYFYSDIAGSPYLYFTGEFQTVTKDGQTTYEPIYEVRDDIYSVIINFFSGSANYEKFGQSMAIFFKYDESKNIATLVNINDTVVNGDSTPNLDGGLIEAFLVEDSKYSYHKPYSTDATGTDGYNYSTIRENEYVYIKNGNGVKKVQFEEALCHTFNATFTVEDEYSTSLIFDEENAALYASDLDSDTAITLFVHRMAIVGDYYKAVVNSLYEDSDDEYLRTDFDNYDYDEDGSFIDYFKKYFKNKLKQLCLEEDLFTLEIAEKDNDESDEDGDYYITFIKCKYATSGITVSGTLNTETDRANIKNHINYWVKECLLNTRNVQNNKTDKIAELLKTRFTKVNTVSNQKAGDLYYASLGSLYAGELAEDENGVLYSTVQYKNVYIDRDSYVKILANPESGYRFDGWYFCEYDAINNKWYATNTKMSGESNLIYTDEVLQAYFNEKTQTYYYITDYQTDNGNGDILYYFDEAKLEPAVVPAKMLNKVRGFFINTGIFEESPNYVQVYPKTTMLGTGYYYDAEWLHPVDTNIYPVTELTYLEAINKINDGTYLLSNSIVYRVQDEVNPDKYHYYRNVNECNVVVEGNTLTINTLHGNHRYVAKFVEQYDSYIFAENSDDSGIEILDVYYNSQDVNKYELSVQEGTDFIIRTDRDGNLMTGVNDDVKNNLDATNLFVDEDNTVAFTSIIGGNITYKVNGENVTKPKYSSSSKTNFDHLRAGFTNFYIDNTYRVNSLVANEEDKEPLSLRSMFFDVMTTIYVVVRVQADFQLTTHSLGFNPQYEIVPIVEPTTEYVEANAKAKPNDKDDYLFYIFRLSYNRDLKNEYASYIVQSNRYMSIAYDALVANYADYYKFDATVNPNGFAWYDNQGTNGNKIEFSISRNANNNTTTIKFTEDYLRSVITTSVPNRTAIINDVKFKSFKNIEDGFRYINKAVGDPEFLKVAGVRRNSNGDNVIDTRDEMLIETGNIFNHVSNVLFASKTANNKKSIIKYGQKNYINLSTLTVYNFSVQAVLLNDNQGSTIQYDEDGKVKISGVSADDLKDGEKYISLLNNTIYTSAGTNGKTYIGSGDQTKDPGITFRTQELYDTYNYEFTDQFANLPYLENFGNAFEDLPIAENSIVLLEGLENRADEFYIGEGADKKTYNKFSGTFDDVNYAFAGWYEQKLVKNADGSETWTDLVLMSTEAQRPYITLATADTVIVAVYKKIVDISITYNNAEINVQFPFSVDDKGTPVTYGTTTVDGKELTTVSGKFFFDRDFSMTLSPTGGYRFEKATATINGSPVPDYEPSRLGLGETVLNNSFDLTLPILTLNNGTFDSASINLNTKEVALIYLEIDNFMRGNKHNGINFTLDKNGTTLLKTTGEVNVVYNASAKYSITTLGKDDTQNQIQYSLVAGNLNIYGYFDKDTTLANNWLTVTYEKCSGVETGIEAWRVNNYNYATDALPYNGTTYNLNTVNGTKTSFNIVFEYEDASLIALNDSEALDLSKNKNHYYLYAYIDGDAENVIIRNTYYDSIDNVATSSLDSYKNFLSIGTGTNTFNAELISLSYNGNVEGSLDLVNGVHKVRGSETFNFFDDTLIVLTAEPYYLYGDQMYVFVGWYKYSANYETENAELFKDSSSNPSISINDKDLYYCYEAKYVKATKFNFEFEGTASSGGTTDKASVSFDNNLLYDYVTFNINSKINNSVYNYLHLDDGLLDPNMNPVLEMIKDFLFPYVFELNDFIALDSLVEIDGQTYILNGCELMFSINVDKGYVVSAVGAYGATYSRTDLEDNKYRFKFSEPTSDEINMYVNINEGLTAEVFATYYDSVNMLEVLQQSQDISLAKVESLTASGTYLSYRKGGSLTANFLQPTKYYFIGWYVNDELVSDNINYEFNLTENIILEARYTDYVTVNFKSLIYNTESVLNNSKIIINYTTPDLTAEELIINESGRANIPVGTQISVTQVNTNAAYQFMYWSQGTNLRTPASYDILSRESVCTYDLVERNFVTSKNGTTNATINITAHYVAASRITLQKVIFASSEDNAIKDTAEFKALFDLHMTYTNIYGERITVQLGTELSKVYSVARNTLIEIGTSINDKVRDVYLLRSLKKGTEVIVSRPATIAVGTSNMTIVATFAPSTQINVSRELNGVLCTYSEINVSMTATMESNGATYQMINYSIANHLDSFTYKTDPTYNFTFVTSCSKYQFIGWYVNNVFVSSNTTITKEDINNADGLDDFEDLSQIQIVARYVDVIDITLSRLVNQSLSANSDLVLTITGNIFEKIGNRCSFEMKTITLTGSSVTDTYKFLANTKVVITTTHLNGFEIEKFTYSKDGGTDQAITTYKANSFNTVVTTNTNPLSGTTTAHNTSSTATKTEFKVYYKTNNSIDYVINSNSGDSEEINHGASLVSKTNFHDYNDESFTLKLNYNNANYYLDGIYLNGTFVDGTENVASGETITIDIPTSLRTSNLLVDIRLSKRVSINLSVAFGGTNDVNEVRNTLKITEDINLYVDNMSSPAYTFTSAYTNPQFVYIVNTIVDRLVNVAFDPIRDADGNNYYFNGWYLTDSHLPANSEYLFAPASSAISQTGNISFYAEDGLNLVAKFEKEQSTETIDEATVKYQLVNSTTTTLTQTKAELSVTNNILTYGPNKYFFTGYYARVSYNNALGYKLIKVADDFNDVVPSIYTNVIGQFVQLVRIETTHTYDDATSSVYSVLSRHMGTYNSTYSYENNGYTFDTLFNSKLYVFVTDKTGYKSSQNSYSVDNIVANIIKEFEEIRRAVKTTILEVNNRVDIDSSSQISDSASDQIIEIEHKTQNLIISVENNAQSTINVTIQHVTGEVDSYSVTKDSPLNIDLEGGAIVTLSISYAKNEVLNGYNVSYNGNTIKHTNKIYLYTVDATYEEATISATIKVGYSVYLDPTIEFDKGHVELKENSDYYELIVDVNSGYEIESIIFNYSGGSTVINAITEVDGKFKVTYYDQFNTVQDNAGKTLNLYVLLRFEAYTDIRVMVNFRHYTAIYVYDETNGGQYVFAQTEDDSPITLDKLNTLFTGFDNLICDGVGETMTYQNQVITDSTSIDITLIETMNIFVTHDPIVNVKIEFAELYSAKNLGSSKSGLTVVVGGIELTGTTFANGITFEYCLKDGLEIQIYDKNNYYLVNHIISQDHNHIFTNSIVINEANKNKFEKTGNAYKVPVIIQENQYTMSFSGTNSTYSVNDNSITQATQKIAISGSLKVNVEYSTSGSNSLMTITYPYQMVAENVELEIKSSDYALVAYDYYDSNIVSNEGAQNLDSLAYLGQYEHTARYYESGSSSLTKRFKSYILNGVTEVSEENPYITINLGDYENGSRFVENYVALNSVVFNFDQTQLNTVSSFDYIALYICVVDKDGNRFVYDFADVKDGDYQAITKIEKGQVAQFVIVYDEAKEVPLLNIFNKADYAVVANDPDVDANIIKHYTVAISENATYTTDFDGRITRVNLKGILYTPNMSITESVLDENGIFVKVNGVYILEYGTEIRLNVTTSDLLGKITHIARYDNNTPPNYVAVKDKIYIVGDSTDSDLVDDAKNIFTDYGLGWDIDYWIQVSPIATAKVTAKIIDKQKVGNVNLKDFPSNAPTVKLETSEVNNIGSGTKELNAVQEITVSVSTTIPEGYFFVGFAIYNRSYSKSISVSYSEGESHQVNFETFTILRNYEIIGTTASLDFKVTGAVEIVALFEARVYKLTVYKYNYIPEEDVTTDQLSNAQISENKDQALDHGGYIDKTAEVSSGMIKGSLLVEYNEDAVISSVCYPFMEFVGWSSHNSGESIDYYWDQEKTIINSLFPDKSKIGDTGDFVYNTVVAPGMSYNENTNISSPNATTTTNYIAIVNVRSDKEIDAMFTAMSYIITINLSEMLSTYVYEDTKNGVESNSLGKYLVYADYVRITKDWKNPMAGTYTYYDTLGTNAWNYTETTNSMTIYPDDPYVYTYYDWNGKLLPFPTKIASDLIDTNLSADASSLTNGYATLKYKNGNEVQLAKQGFAGDQKNANIKADNTRSYMWYLVNGANDESDQAIYDALIQTFNPDNNDILYKYGYECGTYETFWGNPVVKNLNAFFDLSGDSPTLRDPSSVLMTINHETTSLDWTVTYSAGYVYSTKKIVADESGFPLVSVSIKDLADRPGYSVGYLEYAKFRKTSNPFAIFDTEFNINTFNMDTLLENISKSISEITTIHYNTHQRSYSKSLQNFNMDLFDNWEPDSEIDLSNTDINLVAWWSDKAIAVDAKITVAANVNAGFDFSTLSFTGWKDETFNLTGNPSETKTAFDGLTCNMSGCRNKGSSRCFDHDYLIDAYFIITVENGYSLLRIFEEAIENSDLMKVLSQFSQTFGFAGANLYSADKMVAAVYAKLCKVVFGDISDNETSLGRIDNLAHGSTGRLLSQEDELEIRAALEILGAKYKWENNSYVIDDSQPNLYESYINYLDLGGENSKLTWKAIDVFELLTKNKATYWNCDGNLETENNGWDMSGLYKVRGQNRGSYTGIDHNFFGNYATTDDIVYTQVMLQEHVEEQDNDYDWFDNVYWAEKGYDYLNIVTLNWDAAVQTDHKFTEDNMNGEFVSDDIKRDEVNWFMDGMYKMFGSSMHKCIGTFAKYVRSAVVIDDYIFKGSSNVLSITSKMTITKERLQTTSNDFSPVPYLRQLVYYVIVFWQGGFYGLALTLVADLVMLAVSEGEMSFTSQIMNMEAPWS